MTLDMRQAIGYLSAVMTCAAVWFAAGSAGSARAGCNPAPGEVCCETDVTEECEEPAKVLLNGCSGMCEALPPGPGGEVALASSVDFTTEAGLKRMRYDRHGVADDCDPAVWEEVEEFSAAPEFTWTLSGPGCSESGVGSTASGTATQAGTYTVTFNATCDDECSEFPNGTSVSAVLTVLPPMTLSFSPAMLGLDRTDDGGEHKEGEASVDASVCPDAEPFYTWAPKAGVCGIPPGQPNEGAPLTAVTYRTPDKEQCSSSYMDQTVSVDVSPRGSVSSNLFTVVKLDVTVGGVAEADEETAGAFVPYEADTNGTLSVRGIAALKPVAIECSPDDLPDSETVTVAAPAESLFEKIGDQYVPAQSEYKACEIGDKQFFLHGHAASGALRDLKVEVTHANSGAKDKAKFTVVKIVSIEPDPSAFIENYYQGSPLDSPANRVYTIPVSPSVIGNGTDPAGFVWPLHVNVRAVVEPAVPENELPESCGLVGGLNIPPNKLLHWVDLRAPKKDVFTFLNCGVDSGLKTTVYVFDARIKPFVDEGDRCIINVGHSWGQYWLNDPSLALIGSPAYLLVSRDVGFFPAPGDWTNKIWGDGVIRLDGAAGSDDHPITGHGNYRAVSFKKFRQALHLVYAKLPPNSPHYGLFDYNCTDFAIDLGLWVDVTTMSPSGTSTPWDFSDWLRVCPGL